ncbi:MAG: hypothetical protein ABIF80_05470 [Patescibacteria group bacterium]
MPVSQRIQNLQKNPTASRGHFHDVAAKMMGKKSVTKSVEKNLKKAGVFYGKKKLTRSQFEKGVRAISDQMSEGGIKENRYAKDMRASLRSKKGMVQGGHVEKAFKTGVQAQMGEDVSIGSFFDLDQGTRRKFLSIMIDKGQLSEKNKELMRQSGLDPAKGIKELKKFAERITSMNQYQRAREIEEEGNIAAETGKQDKNASSASDYGKESASNSEDDKPDATQQKSPSQNTVPLRGGIGGTVARIENPEMGMEQMITAAEGEALQNRRAEQKSAEMPEAEHAGEFSKPEEEGDDGDLDDMAI